MSKEFKMGFIEEVEPLKLTTIPKKYQKLIETTENRWFNKMQKLAKIYQKRIDYLEHRLSNCIEPKFKIGQEVWYVWNKSQRTPFRCIIDNIVYDSSKNYKLKYDSEHYICIKEEHLYATEEEAKVKLREMQDGNNN